MKKIENFVAVAPKIKTGSLQYCLWTDDDGALYVQIVRNLTETMTPGTHPKLLFRVADYLNDRNIGDASRKMHGINPETFSDEISRDNDTAGFLKTILNHLFP